MTLWTYQHSLRHSSGACFPLTHHIVMSTSEHQNCLPSLLLPGEGILKVTYRSKGMITFQALDLFYDAFFFMTRVQITN